MRQQLLCWRLSCVGHRPWCGLCHIRSANILQYHCTVLQMKLNECMQVWEGLGGWTGWTICCRSEQDLSLYCAALAMCHQSHLGAKGFSAARARKAFRIVCTLFFRRGNTVHSVQNSLAAAVVSIVAVYSSWRLSATLLFTQCCFGADCLHGVSTPTSCWSLLVINVDYTIRQVLEDKLKRLAVSMLTRWISFDSCWPIKREGFEVINIII